MNRVKLVAVLLAVVSLSACATFQTTPTRSSPENGAIYGYFDFPKDQFGELYTMSFMKYPLTARAYIATATDIEYVIVGNAFFAYDAVPGQYALRSVGSIRQSLLGNNEYNFDLIDTKGAKDRAAALERFKKQLITVPKGKMVFMGAYAVSLEKKPGFFSSGSFSIGPTKTPSEKKILQELLPSLQGTPWEQPVMDRIDALK